METEVWTRRLNEAFESWELCFFKERARKYEAAAGELLSVEVKEEEGIALRAIKGGRMSFSYTFEKEQEAYAALMENVAAVMPFLEGDPHHVFPAASAAYPKLDLYDEKGLAFPDEKKIASLLEMESTIRAFDRRITTTRNCELHQGELSVGIINSHGLTAEAKKTVYTLSAMAVAAEDGEEVSWYDWSWAPAYGDLDGQKLGRRVAEKTVSFLSGEVLKTGLYDGLLTPAAACQVLEILSPSFLAENLYKEKTRLKEKVGSEVFSPLLTLVDSGAAGMGAFPFDGEGVPSRENVLVREGVFEGFLYDTYYGSLLKKASTGNAVRSGVKEPPKCGPRGFSIVPGAWDEAGGIERGIVVEELMGTHTANPVTGDFSVGAIGHLHEGGGRTPFKGVILSGNLFDLLSQVRAVGKNVFFYGPYGAPALLVEGLRISGK